MITLLESTKILALTSWKTSAHASFLRFKYRDAANRDRGNYMPKMMRFWFADFLKGSFRWESQMVSMKEQRYYELCEDEQTIKYILGGQ